MSRTPFERYRSAFAAALIGLGLAGTDAAASWIQIVDLNGSDTATNPGYPGGQSPTAIGNYLKDLLDLANAPTLRDEELVDGAGLSGIGNPTGGDQFLLAFHFGNGENTWEHTGPYDVFFSCDSDCNTFSLPNGLDVGNYRLYSVLGNPVERVNIADAAIPEPATIAMLGLGFIGLYAARRRRAAVPVVNTSWKDTWSDEVAPLKASVNAIAPVDRAR